MATTEQKRKWYPEHVLNHADRGKAGYKPQCDWSGAALIAVPNNLDGVYVEPVHPKTAEAWDAYVFLMRHFNQSITNAGGVNSCRNIGSSVWPSLHAYIIAIDNPPNDRKSAEFQSAVLAIKCNSGARVFKNLDSINDRMHDEIDCSPADLATGIDWGTVEGYDMPTAEEIAKAVMLHPTLTEGVNVQLALTRTERGINALLLRPADDLDESEVAAQILEAFGDDQARLIADKLIAILAD